MNEQVLDLRNALRLVLRRKVLVCVCAALGLAAGVAYTAANPPMPSSSALVVLAPSFSDTSTQVVVAASDPVLAGALRSVDHGLTPSALRKRLHVSSPAADVLSITAQGRTAAQAEATADAIANSYVSFIRSGRENRRTAQAQVLAPAAQAETASLPARMAATAGLGFLAGVLIGSIAALAISRSDRRLRQRDEIAEAAGARVLASVAVGQPSDAKGWRRLLAEYQPRPAEAAVLRRVLQQLDLAGGEDDAASVAVLSIASDRKAAALGPQLAVASASLGIPTLLVVGPQQDPSATAALRSACAVWPDHRGRPGHLRVAVSDLGDRDQLPPSGLAVVVAVVDGEAPRVGDTMRADATLLGVSAGAATGPQISRVAANAAAAGRRLAGVLVADPDTSDRTTGRLPHLARPEKLKMRTSTATETTR